jgi:hypothetical protein
MKRLYINLVDGLHHLFTGDDSDEATIKQKSRIVFGWVGVILFCVVMLKLLLG